MKSGGHILMPMYIKPGIPMENPTSVELDFVSQNAKSETSSSAFYGGI